MRAILIATNRSGSTFLNHALDSHIDIGWERGEPLTTMRGDPDPARLVDWLLSRQGYQVTGCKLSYKYVRKVLGFEELTPLGVDRLIHLHRNNVVRTILSSMINVAVRDGKLDYAMHTTTPLPAPHIMVDVKQFMSECKRYKANVKRMQKELDTLPIEVLYITYEAMFRGCIRQALDPLLTSQLCSFLGVETMPLRARLCRLNPYPIDEIVLNWDELHPALVNSEFAQDVY